MVNPPGKRSVFVRVLYGALLFGFCSVKHRTKNQASAYASSGKQGNNQNREIKVGKRQNPNFGQNPKNPPDFAKIWSPGAPAPHFVAIR